MTRNFLSILCAGILLLCACSSSKKIIAQSNMLSAKEKKGGWVLLFDGQSMNGWHSYNKTTVDKHWRVVDGTMMMDPSLKDNINKGDIITDKEYENYELLAEWKISEGGNSGIIFDIQENPEMKATYGSGAEMQVLDNIKAEDNKKENHLAGQLYDLSGSAALSKPKPVGEWNEVKIVQNKGRITLYFNGIKTADVQAGSDEWNNMISNSKFKNWNDFMKVSKGKIAFQDHGNEVAFRNIRIKEL